MASERVFDELTGVRIAFAKLQLRAHLQDHWLHLGQQM
jgi:hypothetical protein